MTLPFNNITGDKLTYKGTAGVSSQPGPLDAWISNQLFGLLQLKGFSEDHSTSVATSMLEEVIHDSAMFQLTKSLSLVALHGQNGDAMKIWQSANTIWFKDLLPSLVPDVDMRKSLFGYYSEVLPGLTKDSM